MRLCVFSGQDKKNFAKALSIREKVFVQEQNVPLQLERDEYDSVAEHVLVFANDLPVATGRIFKDAHDTRIARLGRVAVMEKQRGKGIGRIVIEKLIELARAMKVKRIVIHAQLQVADLYVRFGFKRVGKTFEEAGIDHIEMVLLL